MEKTLDIAGVVSELRELIAQNRSDEALSKVAALLAQMSDQNRELQLRLGKLLKHQFGRRSEKIDPAQLALLLGALAAKPAQAPAEVVPAQPPAPPASDGQLPAPKPRKGHGRRPLPESLPVETVKIPVPAEERVCAICGAEKTCIGHERSETIEYVPASFKKVVFEREKLACRPCQEGVVVAPPAAKVIDGGLPGPGLLAHVVLSKYKDSLPLHRLRDIYKRCGVDFPVSTLADWVAQAADVLGPIAERIAQQALASHLLQTDDTGLRVLDRDHPAGIKRGHIWVYVGDSRWAAFRYTPDWQSEDARAFLKDRRGWLLHDGYAGYDALHKATDGPIEVACWTHTRRGFVEALEAGDSRAAVPVDLVRQLYAVESAADKAGDTHELRLERRRRDSAPVLDRLWKWMAETALREPPKSPVAQAIGYALRRRDALSRFLEDGRLPLDNNGSENALRGIALGRKNFLFAGSDAGAQRAATLYTIIGTCTLCKVEPWGYLREVLTRLAAGWSARRIDELLPPAFAAAAAKDQPQQQLDAARS